MAKKHESESAFNATLAARLTAATTASTQSGVNGAMRMNAAPVGPSKSLEALLENDSSATTVAPQNLITTPPVDSEPVQDVIVRLQIQLVDDSPWQPRGRYDESELQDLGQAMKDRGQDEPIKVRKLASGRYQLIYGHRRIRAARFIGWADIKAVVVELSDRDAELATLVSNESQVGLSDWERAQAYQQALDHGLAEDQKEVGRIFSCSQSRVSQCLTLYKLPEPILLLLRKYPGLIKYRHAKTILDLLKEHPGDHAAISTAVEGMIDQPDLEAAELRAHVERTLRSKRPRPKAIPPRTIGDKNGSSAFSVKLRDRQIVIDIEDGVDVDLAGKRTLAALREFALTFELPAREKALKS